MNVDHHFNGCIEFHYIKEHSLFSKSLLMDIEFELVYIIINAATNILTKKSYHI